MTTLMVQYENTLERLKALRRNRYSECGEIALFDEQEKLKSQMDDAQLNLAASWWWRAWPTEYDAQQEGLNNEHR